MSLDQAVAYVRMIDASSGQRQCTREFLGRCSQDDEATVDSASQSVTACEPALRLLDEAQGVNHSSGRGLLTGGT
jgi:hypothetical protein